MARQAHAILSGMDHEDPTLDVEAALWYEEELARLSWRSRGGGPRIHRGAPPREGAPLLSEASVEARG